MCGRSDNNTDEDLGEPEEMGDESEKEQAAEAKAKAKTKAKAKAKATVKAKAKTKAKAKAMVKAKAKSKSKQSWYGETGGEPSDVENLEGTESEMDEEEGKDNDNDTPGPSPAPEPADENSENDENPKKTKKQVKKPKKTKAGGDGGDDPNPKAWDCVACHSSGSGGVGLNGPSYRESLKLKRANFGLRGGETRLDFKGHWFCNSNCTAGTQLLQTINIISTPLVSRNLWHAYIYIYCTYTDRQTNIHTCTVTHIYMSVCACICMWAASSTFKSTMKMT